MRFDVFVSLYRNSVTIGAFFVPFAAVPMWPLAALPRCGCAQRTHTRAPRSSRANIAETKLNVFPHSVLPSTANASTQRKTEIHISFDGCTEVISQPCVARTQRRPGERAAERERNTRRQCIHRSLPVRRPCDIGKCFCIAIDIVLPHFFTLRFETDEIPRFRPARCPLPRSFARSALVSSLSRRL